MSDPKDPSSGPVGDHDVVTQPLGDSEGGAAPAERAATPADEAALPVVEVSAPAIEIAEEPEEGAADEPAAEPGAEPVAQKTAEGGRKKKKKKAAPVAETAPAAAAAAAPAPAAASRAVPAPTPAAPAPPPHAEAEPPHVIEMKTPDRADFSLLERSVLIEAPEEEDAGALVEDPYAGLTGTQRVMRKLSPRLLGLVLLLFGGAGVAGTFVTLLNPFRDWFMHLLMYSVIFAFYLLYLKAHARRRPVWRYLMMLVTAALSGFFAWILMGYIPAQKVWYARSVLWREEVTLLWLPIGLLAGAAVLLLFHCVVVARFAPRRRPRE